MATNFKSMAELMTTAVYEEWRYEVFGNKSNTSTWNIQKGSKKNCQILMVNSIKKSAKNMNTLVKELSQSIVQNNVEQEFKKFIKYILTTYQYIGGNGGLDALEIDFTANELLYDDNKPSSFFKTLIKQTLKRVKKSNYTSTF